MDPAFEPFDHTADTGIRARADAMAGLVRAAAEGLYAVIGELALCGPEQPFLFDEAGDAAAVLLRDYLTELLVAFEQERRVVVKPTVVSFSDSRLTVEAQSMQVNDEQSVLLHEVKAVTYHELNIRRTPEGYEATVIVDI